MLNGRSHFTSGDRPEDPQFAAVLPIGLEGYLHGRLQDARPTDAVDIANAAAECAGDLTEV